MALRLSPRLRIGALAAVMLALTAPTAFAQKKEVWPTKTIRILVGFPAGSTPDAAARAIATPLAKALGQPVVVENKPGASGNIATDQIAKATDDHTLGIVINGNLTSSKMLFSNLPYDPDHDFTFLTLVGTAPLVLVARDDLPSGAAFFAAARKGGDQWNYGSVGVGSVAHLGMELLKARAPGVEAQHIPYQGNPAVMAALLSQQIQMALVPPGLAMPQVKSGKVKAIGVTSSASSELAPGVPPLADAGIKNFNLEVWVALVGPASLSKAAQERLAPVLATIMQDPETRKQLFNQGWQAQPASASRLKARVEEESKIMGNIITSQHIKIQ